MWILMWTDCKIACEYRRFYMKVLHNFYLNYYFYQFTLKELIMKQYQIWVLEIKQFEFGKL